MPAVKICASGADLEEVQDLCGREICAAGKIRASGKICAAVKIVTAVKKRRMRRGWLQYRPGCEAKLRKLSNDVNESNLDPRQTKV